MQAKLNEQADQLFQQATETLNDGIRAYAYQTWIRSTLLQGRYQDAANFVGKAKSPGMEVDAQLNSEIKQALAQ